MISNLNFVLSTMSVEEKFNAAVNVIRSLPKNGPFQPSNDLMLRFYGLFKQATLGPCKGHRPPFWDIVGRAKYDAWKILGNTPKTEAMSRYVNELHTIVETMSYSDKVANFLDTSSQDMENINMADLELVVGDIIEEVRSRPNSPLASRDTSPQRLHSSTGSSVSSSPGPPSDSEHSDGEYVDTIEAPEPKKSFQSSIQPTSNHVQKEHKSRTRSKVSSSHVTVDISREISQAVQGLKSDVEKLAIKIKSIEKRQNSAVAVKKSRGLFGLKPQLIAFLIVWPFIASFILSKFLNRRRT